MWMDALAKEIYNIGVAFEVLDEREQAPNGLKEVPGHLVWDMKMDFTRKARWVLNWHKMPDPVGPICWGGVQGKYMDCFHLCCTQWTGYPCNRH